MMSPPFIAVANEHDRTEFLRDAAAALRVGDPRAARVFLTRLCRRRARVELHAELRGRLITQDDAEHMFTSRTHELLRLCNEMGFCATRLTDVVAVPSFRFGR